jgi:hypothetical protein
VVSPFPSFGEGGVAESRGGRWIHNADNKPTFVLKIFLAIINTRNTPRAFINLNMADINNGLPLNLLLKSIWHSL